MSTLSERITKLREDKKVSVKQAAFEMGLNYKSLIKYESCEKKPTIEEMELLASYYGVCEDYLVGMTDIPRGIKRVILD